LPYRLRVRGGGQDGSEHRAYEFNTRSRLERLRQSRLTVHTLFDRNERTRAASLVETLCQTPEHRQTHGFHVMSP
jgi:hypothetical protein